MPYRDLDRPGYQQLDGVHQHASDGLLYGYRAAYQVQPSLIGNFAIRIHAVIGQGGSLWRFQTTVDCSDALYANAEALVVEAIRRCIDELPLGAAELRTL